MSLSAALELAARGLLWAALGLALLLAAFALRVRLAADDPARWHVDPRAAVPPDGPRFALLLPEPWPPAVAAAARRFPGRVQPAPEVAGAPAEVMARLEALALAEPRTRVIARDADGLGATFVQRSALWRFPDYVSVRVEPAGPGRSRILAFSRSRFGRSDLGVNPARLRRWLRALEAG